MTREFHNISIRGRLAYGMTCLERIIIAFDCDNYLLQSVVFPKIWEFTSTNDLGEWEQKISEVEPMSIMEENENSNLKSLYAKLPKDIINTIDDVIEIGTANIYGGTGNYSPLTLEPLNSILKTVDKLKISLPDISSYKKSNFNECNGWGDNHTKDFYI